MNNQANAHDIPTTGSHRSRLVYMTPSNTGEPRGFAEALGSTVEEPQVPADFIREHSAALVLWLINQETREPPKQIVSFDYRIVVRNEQPLRTEEMEELTSALYQALDRIVDRRRGDRDEGGNVDNVEG